MGHRDELVARARRPEIMAEAVYAVLSGGQVAEQFSF